ncbi:MFS transporter [bacterium]|nr:MFS transporter [bacterium]
MAGGALLGCVGLALLAASQSVWQFVLVLALVCGPAMAATFYEPVYVLMNRWFTAEERPRAYGILTLLSGFSITIYTPLTRWLVDEFGWRQAVCCSGSSWQRSALSFRCCSTSLWMPDGNQSGSLRAGSWPKPGKGRARPMRGSGRLRWHSLEQPSPSAGSPST